ncbi:uncharacterized protein PF3D7_1120000-like [Mytilus edulis]|uniref:uncharacterized protein PF3D7_1120000-like n=1 Tax=Mytilus edulis TaxID=6550 RepID=UPI0039EF491C
MALVSSQKCNDCEKEKGFFFCYDCKHVLCQECRPKHNRIPALKTHTITALDVIDRSAYTLRSECTSHNQECCLYCSNCKILTCTQCVTDNHKTHVFVDISAVTSEARKSTEDYISKIKEKISNLSENITKVKSVHIKKLEEEAEKVLCKINCTSKNLTRVIDSQTDISKTNVEDWRNLEKADVEVHLKSLEQMYKVHTKLCDELENMLREKHDKSFFLYFQKLKTDCENLEEIPEDIDFNDIKEFDTNTFVHHVTAMIVETFSISDYGRTTELKQQITDNKLELVALQESSEKRIKAVTEENTTVKQKLEQSERRIRTLVEENSKFKRQQELDYGRTTELKEQITDNKLQLVALHESSEKRIKAVTEENTTIKQKLEQSERRIKTLVEENSKFKRQQELPPEVKRHMNDKEKVLSNMQFVRSVNLEDKLGREYVSLQKITLRPPKELLITALNASTFRIMLKLKTFAKKLEKEHVYEPVDTLFIIRKRGTHLYRCFGYGELRERFIDDEVLTDYSPNANTKEQSMPGVEKDTKVVFNTRENPFSSSRGSGKTLAERQKDKLDNMPIRITLDDKIKVVKQASDTEQSNLSTNDQSILYYIAGFIIKALKKRYSCVSTNKSSIVSKLLNSTNNTTFVTTYGKWFTKQDRGGLQKPCDTFFFLVRELETIVRKSISPPYSASSLSLQPLKESFMESFMVKYYTDIMFKGETCDTMSSMTEDIIHLFLTVRGYAFTRIERNKISNSSKASSGLRNALKEIVSN